MILDFGFWIFWILDFGFWILDAVEFVGRKEIDELSENGSSLVQASSPSSLISRDYGTEPEDLSSNRPGPPWYLNL